MGSGRTGASRPTKPLRAVSYTGPARRSRSTSRRPEPAHPNQPRHASSGWGATPLELAIGATRYGSGRPKLATRVRLHGLEALHHVLEQLDSRTRSSVRDEAAGLADRGVTAILRGSTKYPRLLDLLENASPALFTLGNSSLLNKSSIGICGSRNVSDEGLRAAQNCGEMAATQGLISVSGYARGVDMATHVSTLEHGGSTIIVLPEGIQNFKVKRGEISTVWDPSRTLVVS